jgi:hypothetical protein
MCIVVEGEGDENMDSGRRKWQIVQEYVLEERRRRKEKSQKQTATNRRSIGRQQRGV